MSLKENTFPYKEKKSFSSYHVFVDTIMRTNLFKAHTTTSLFQALKLMNQNQLDILPILNEGEPIGVIKKAQIQHFYEQHIKNSTTNSQFILRTTAVTEIMDSLFTLIPPHYSIGDIIDLFNEIDEIYAFVVEEHKFKGIVTTEEINEYLKSHFDIRRAHAS